MKVITRVIIIIIIIIIIITTTKVRHAKKIKVA